MRRVLRRQRFERGRSRAEDELPLLAQSRPTASETRFVALTGSYHGETLGALSVTDVPLYRETYAPLLLEPIFAPSPDACAGRARRGCRPRMQRVDWAICGNPAARRQHDLRRHRRAARAMRGRHAHVRPELPDRLRAPVRRVRRAPDRRRDRGRLRPHRHAVRVRAGRDRAGFPVPVERPDRRHRCRCRRC